MTESPSRYRLADTIAAETIGTEMVLLNTASGQYYELNETAAMVFRLLDGGCDDEEIVEIFGGEFEIDEETARADVQALIASLLEQGLIAENPV